MHLTASKILCGIKPLTQSLHLSSKAEQSLRGSLLRGLPLRFSWCYLCSDAHGQLPALGGFLFYEHFAKSIFTARLEMPHTVDLCTLKAVIFFILPPCSLG